ncbi:hypothetical protein [Neobacillus mesonae]|uniref:hypothetical protein n=1 Tax=Neobacillus mesonae TaxID=1193713 RepID=UPI0020401BAC|nr:hypothetical protein [Neobacillus mesonae]MCM3568642.1 hypothetical protein [Neobacillus mesonae]
MTYKFLIAKEDDLFEKYLFYMVKHRKSINSYFTLQQIYLFLQSHRTNGGAIVALDNAEDIIGAVGLVYGLPENVFQNKEIVRIELLHVKEEYRHTFLFYRGVKTVIRHLQDSKPTVKEIEFYIPSGQPQLSKLLNKIAPYKNSEQTNFGDEDYYHVQLGDLSNKLEKLERR